MHALHKSALSRIGISVRGEKRKNGFHRTGQSRRARESVRNPDLNTLVLLGLGARQQRRFLSRRPSRPGSVHLPDANRRPPGKRVTNLAQPLATDVTAYQLTGVTPMDKCWQL